MSRTRRWSNVLRITRNGNRRQWHRLERGSEHYQSKSNENHLSSLKGSLLEVRLCIQRWMAAFRENNASLFIQWKEKWWISTGGITKANSVTRIIHTYITRLRLRSSRSASSLALPAFPTWIPYNLSPQHHPARCLRSNLIRARGPVHPGHRPTGTIRRAIVTRRTPWQCVLH